MIAKRWVRLLPGIDEEIRRAMHPGWRDEVHAIYERIEAEARGTKQADREVSVQQTQTVPESVTDKMRPCKFFIMPIHISYFLPRAQFLLH